MHIALAAAFVFAILTLWVPAYWPVTVFQVSIFSLAAAAVVRWRDRFPRVSWPLAVFTFATAWGAIQCAAGTTVYRFETTRAMVKWGTFLAVFVIGDLLFRDRAVSRWFRSAMLWLGLVVAIVATVQSFTAREKVFWIFPSGYGDTMGPIAYHNHFAAFVEGILPMALYRAFRSRHHEFLYGSMAAVLYASVIASASRAGTVLATAEILAVVAIMAVRAEIGGRTVILTTVKILALLAVFTFVVGWQVILQRFAQADPYAGRREVAISSLHMAADRPWMGFGLGTWPTVYPRYASFDMGLFMNRAHSDWLEWTAEGGYPFGIAMATLFFWVLAPALREVWGLGVISVLLHATVDYPFSRPALGSWFVVVIAMLAASKASHLSKKQVLPT